MTTSLQLDNAPPVDVPEPASLALAALGLAALATVRRRALPARAWRCRGAGRGSAGPGR